MFINRGWVKHIRIYSHTVAAHKGGFTMEIFIYLCRKRSSNDKSAIIVFMVWTY